LRILVPYVTLAPELPAALDAQGITAAFVDTSSPTGYWETLAAYWDQGDTFIVLEQDKIPAPGLLKELWDCGRPWCTTPVAMRGVEETSPYPSLSCTKFGTACMATRPTLLDDIALIDFGLGYKEWSRLDLGIAGLLSMDFEPHWHAGGRVEHLH
jgi:hypothetical protein